MPDSSLRKEGDTDWEICVTIRVGKSRRRYKPEENDPGVADLLAHARRRLHSDLDPLPPSLFNRLKAAGITTREELSKHTISSLLQLPGISTNALQQLEKAGLIRLQHTEE